MVPNCAITFTRACADGTGIVQKTIGAAEFFVNSADYSSIEAAQIAVNALAEEIVRGQALNTVLYCNTILPSDLADCGLIEDRPVYNPACAVVYCDGSGVPYCNESSIEYTSVTS